MAIARRFANGDNVGHDTVVLVAPKMLPHATKARLHFITNAQAARGANFFKHFGHVAFHRFQNAIGDKGRIQKIGGGAHAMLGQVANGTVGVAGIGHPVVAMLTTVAIGRDNGAHVRVTGQVRGLTNFVGRGRHGVYRPGNAMVSKFLAHRARLVGQKPDQAKAMRQAMSFASLPELTKAKVFNSPPVFLLRRSAYSKISSPK